MEKRNDKEEEPIASMSIARGRTKTNQEAASLFRSPPNNVTYDINSFPYIESKSMSGIFFFDSSGNPAFNFMRPYPYLNLPTPSFFSIPIPFTILSSSQGLLLCHDFVDHNYHACNPFVHSSSGYRLIPPPPRPSPSHAQICPPSVLSTDLRRTDSGMRFYIISIVLEQQDARLRNKYTFDMYSSHADEWFVGTQPIITGRPIIENTGISTADGSVYWLTEPPHQIVKYNNNGAGTGVSQVSALPKGCYGKRVKLQLGRMGSIGISLVVLRDNVIELFLVRDGFTETVSWEALCSLDVSGIFSSERIELLRFEKEVALWVEDRIVFWTPLLDLGEDGGRTYGQMINRMPEWVNVPTSIGDTIPYVHTKIVPLHFVKAYSGDVGYSGDAKTAPLNLLKSYSDDVKVCSDYDKILPLNLDVSYTDDAKIVPRNLDKSFSAEAVDSDDDVGVER